MLCTLQYAVNTKRHTLHEVEKQATVDHMMGKLGAKSGQSTENQRFRYHNKDVVYKELYQDAYDFCLHMFGSCISYMHSRVDVTHAHTRTEGSLFNMSCCSGFTMLSVGWFH